MWSLILGRTSIRLCEVYVDAAAAVLVIDVEDFFADPLLVKPHLVFPSDALDRDVTDRPGRMEAVKLHHQQTFCLRCRAFLCQMTDFLRAWSQNTPLLPVVPIVSVSNSSFLWAFREVPLYKYTCSFGHCPNGFWTPLCCPFGHFLSLLFCWKWENSLNSSFDVGNKYFVWQWLWWNMILGWCSDGTHSW